MNELTIEEFGQGLPFLVLHGGAGPASVLPFASRLAQQHPARVIVPTHPGFNGTPRPDDVSDVAALARLYADLLESVDVQGVTVVGSSIGGWIAAEMALLASPRVSKVVILNAVGIDVPGHPIADFFSLTFDELAKLSYHDPDRFRIDPAALSDTQKAVMAGNRHAIEVYAGHDMTDPTLAGRLGAVTVPTLVLWGQSDGLADAEYGRAFAAAIPGAVYHPMFEAGHLPQLERPDATVEVIWQFASVTGPL